MSTLEEMTVKAKKTDDVTASIIRRYGNPVSTLLLHLPCTFFWHPGIDGVIGYSVFKNCAVVIGDPACSFNDRAALTLAFQEFCKKSHYSMVYLLASKSFAEWAVQNGCRTSMQVGEELILNPTTFQITQKLRWKINQSHNHGVVVKEYHHDDPKLEKAMILASEEWLKTKHGPQLHLGNVTYPVNRTNERIFYAMQNSRVIGLLVLSPLDIFHGWVVTFYFAIKEASVGASECLLSQVFETLGNENCHYVCLGATAGKQIGETVGISHMKKTFIRMVYKTLSWLFRLGSKRRYFAKFHPHSQPTYMLLSRRLNLNDMLAVKQLLDAKL